MRKVEHSTKLELERIVFIGRTFEEYLNMFALSKEDLHGKKILDCPAGACSFTAIGSKSGYNITACDIAYDHSVADLRRKGFQDIAHAMGHIEIVRENYKWDYFKNVEDLRSNRLHALENCTNHMADMPEKYIPVTLPSLPFKDNEFDLLLSAHFLFMYTDRLDYRFHLDTFKELLRVTKNEIRIFPLVDLEGKRSVHVERLVEELKELGYLAEEFSVPYEFQKNANSMLKIIKD